MSNIDIIAAVIIICIVLVCAFICLYKIAPSKSDARNLNPILTKEEIEECIIKDKLYFLKEEELRLSQQIGSLSTAVNSEECICGSGFNRILDSMASDLEKVHQERLSLENKLNENT